MADWMYVLMPLLALPIVLLFRFVGCKSFGSTPAEDPPEFDISLSPTATGVTQGQKKTVTVTITSKAGFSAATTLSSSGLPGVSAVFAPNPVTPPVNGTITSTLTLDASPSAATGPLVVTITGTATVAAGPLTHSVTLNLTVISATPATTPNFSLSLSPATATVVRGATAAYTVNITRVGGFSGAVAFTTNQGAGTFSPNPASGNSSSLTAAIPGNTPPGPYAFTVTGTSGSLVRTTNGTVIVTSS